MEPERNAAFAARLFQKRALLDAGDPAHEKIRTLAIISGGGMRGVCGAGVWLGLYHLGLAHCFDWIIGISTGAAICGYGLTGKEHARAGATIYYEEGRTGFVDHSWPFPKVHIDYLENVLRAGKKRLAVGELLAHRTEFFVCVTHWETGEGVLIDAKRAYPDPVMAIKASLALTFAYRFPVTVNGENFTDGGMSLPLPWEKAVREFKPTDVLIVSNYSLKESRGMGLTLKDRVLDRLVLHRIPLSLRGAFKNRDASWRENIALAEHSALNVGFLWGDEHVHVLTQDLATLRNATLKGIRDTLLFFGDTKTPPESLMP